MTKVVAQRPGQFLAVDDDVTAETMTIHTVGYLIDAHTQALLEDETEFQSLLKLGYWREVDPYVIETKEEAQKAYDDDQPRDRLGRWSRADVVEHNDVYHRSMSRMGSHRSGLFDKIHHGRDPLKPHKHTRFGALITENRHIIVRHPPKIMAGKEWNEEDHPRDEHGRFTTGNSAPGEVLSDRMRSNSEQWFEKRGLSAAVLQQNVHTLMNRASPETIAKGMRWYENAQALTAQFAEKYGYPQDVVAGMVAALSPQVRWSESERDFKNSNQDQAERVLQTLNGQYGTSINISPEDAQKLYEKDLASSSPTRAANALNVADYNGVDESKHGQNFTGEQDIKNLPPDVLATFAPATSGMLRESATKAFQIGAGADPDDVLGGAKVRAFYNNVLHPGETDDVTIDAHQARLMVGAEYLSDKETAATIGTIGRYEYMEQVIRDEALARGMRPDQVQAISWEQWRIENPAVDRRAQTLAVERMKVESGATKAILELRGGAEEADLMSEAMFTRLVQDDNAFRARTQTKEREYVRDELGRFAETDGITAVMKTETYEKLVDLMRETDGMVIPASDYTKPQSELAHYAEKLPGNQDPVLSMLAHEKGYDEKPTLVSGEELDRRLAAGGTELWRGVTSTAPDFKNNTRESIPVDSAGELMRGDYYAGKGAFGNGTYFAEADPENGRERFQSALFASGYGDQIVRATLSPDAKVAEWDDLNRQAQAERNAFQERTDYGREGVTKEEAQAIDFITADQGRYAVAKGYDAMRVDDGTGSAYVVVLNRGALVVEDKVYGRDVVSAYDKDDDGYPRMRSIT